MHRGPCFCRGSRGSHPQGPHTWSHDILTPAEAVGPRSFRNPPHQQLTGLHKGQETLIERGSPPLPVAQCGWPNKAHRVQPERGKRGKSKEGLRPRHGGERNNRETEPNGQRDGGGQIDRGEIETETEETEMEERETKRTEKETGRDREIELQAYKDRSRERRARDSASWKTQRGAESPRQKRRES